MLFGSLVEFHVWLHSYLYFSLLEKLFLRNLDNSSTPLDTWLIYRAHLLFSSQSRHLSIVRWINQEISCLLDSSSIHWAYFAMDTSRKFHLSKLLKLNTCLDTSRHLYLSRITELLYQGSNVIQSWFSQYVHIFSPTKPLSLTPNLFLKQFSRLFKFFFFTW